MVFMGAMGEHLSYKQGTAVRFRRWVRTLMRRDGLLHPNDVDVGSSPTRLRLVAQLVEHVCTCLDVVLSAHGIKTLLAM